MLRQIPDFLRELREPWLVCVPEELQKHIRFNAEICNVHKDLPEGLQYPGFEGKEYFIADYMSAGGGTISGHPIDEETCKALEQLAKQEYFPKEYDVSAYRDLAEFLKAGGVDLSLERSHSFAKKEEYPELARKYIPKEAFQRTKEIYELLPEHHFGHEHFKELRLGGWGDGAAKCSEYEDPVVHMFEFAVKGARRNYAGLLLHETGHAHFEFLRNDRNRLGEDIYECFKELGGYRGIKPFVIDYLGGIESRIYAIKTVDEFAAEVYLLYVARGTELKKVILLLPERLKKPWQKLYDTFKQSFDGIEYE